MEASPALPCALVPAVNCLTRLAICFWSAFEILNAANIGFEIPIFFPS